MSLEIQKALLFGFIQNMYDEVRQTGNRNDNWNGSFGGHRYSGIFDDQTTTLVARTGYVNDQFWQIQQMKKTTQPDYAVRAVTCYCMSAQNLFTQMTDHINQENVDFHQVNVSAHELFEQSNSVGAAHVKHACVELLHACEENDKD
uniref:Histidine-containing phosphotransfer protein n=1 Tax=Quercus lobata TaxID=97700 RepID=A0A7N2RBR3_QUELO